MPQHTPLPSKPWVKLFQADRDFSTGMKLVVHTLSDDGDVYFDENEVDRIHEVWGHYLIGYVIGKFPSTKAIDKFASHEMCPIII